MKIKEKYLYIFLELFLIIPLMIYIWAWYKLNYAILYGIILIFCSLFALEYTYNSIELIVYINRIELIILILSVSIGVYFIGPWGDFFQGNLGMDNGRVLMELVYQKWPVHYENNMYLNCNFIWLLLPALCGKICNNIKVSKVFLYIIMVLFYTIAVLCIYLKIKKRITNFNNIFFLVFLLTFLNSPNILASLLITPFSDNIGKILPPENYIMSNWIGTEMIKSNMEFVIDNFLIAMPFIGILLLLFKIENKVIQYLVLGIAFFYIQYSIFGIFILLIKKNKYKFELKSFNVKKAVLFIGATCFWLLGIIQTSTWNTHLWFIDNNKLWEFTGRLILYFSVEIGIYIFILYINKELQHIKYLFKGMIIGWIIQMHIPIFFFNEFIISYIWLIQYEVICMILKYFAQKECNSKNVLCIWCTIFCLTFGCLTPIEFILGSVKNTIQTENIEEQKTARYMNIFISENIESLIKSKDSSSLYMDKIIK